MVRSRHKWSAATPSCKAVSIWLSICLGIRICMLMTLHTGHLCWKVRFSVQHVWLSVGKSNFLATYYMTAGHPRPTVAMKHMQKNWSLKSCLAALSEMPHPRSTIGPQHEASERTLNNHSKSDDTAGHGPRRKGLPGCPDGQSPRSSHLVFFHLTNDKQWTHHGESGGRRIQILPISNCNTVTVGMDIINWNL